MNRRLQVDLGALVSNYRLLCDAAAPSRCAAVVKANAYGLGVGPIAKSLSGAGCDAFFVATVQESLELRQILRSADIFVLEGINRDNAKELKDRDVVPVLNTLEQIQIWANVAPNSRSILHLDSGICRLGLPLSDARKLAANTEALGALNIDLSLIHI